METIVWAEPVTYINHRHSVASWLLTYDHKRIGILYLIVVTAAFFLGGLMATLIRLELAQVYEASNAAEDYLDALDIYLLTVAQWEDFHQARYRLAATLSFVEVWSEEWMAAREPTHGRHKQHERILEVFADCLNQRPMR